MSTCRKPTTKPQRRKSFLNKKISAFVPSWLRLLFLMSSPALAESRFPKPEFETKYQYPTEFHPSPRLITMEYFDVLMLILALSLTAWFVLKKRSRTGVISTAAASLLYFGFYREGCVCSVGAIQNVILAIFDSSYAVPVTSLAFFIIPLAFALYFGRAFCASVCPLGCAQELINLKPIQVPQWTAQILGLIPYIYLGLSILYAAAGGMFIICRLDPFVGFFRLNASSSMFVFGAMFLTAGVFVSRPYCRFLCPYGVLLGWFSYFSKYRVQITPSDCISCRLCEAACPFNAIQPANNTAQSETAKGRIRRFMATLVLSPILIASLCWLGGNMSDTFAQVHPTVAMAKQIQAEETGTVTTTTLDSREFRKTGTTLEQLYTEERLIRKRFNYGGYLLGLFLGIIFSIKLLFKCVRHYRASYTIDHVNCYNCARCYSYCPQDQANRIPDIKGEPK